MENVDLAITVKDISKEEQNGKKTKKGKIKFSLYLSDEAEYALRELYIHRLRKDRKADRSKIACDAFLELYEKECKVDKEFH